MGKGNQILDGLWDALNKMVWLNNQVMKEKLNEYKPSEVHCIDYIGSHDQVNVTKLSEAFRMTTGGITKITKKLIEKNVIQSYKKADNKKEVYFTLTEQGTQIFQMHEALHSQFEKRDQAVFDRLTDEEYDSILRFTEAYGRHLDEVIERSEYDVHAGDCDRF